MIAPAPAPSAEPNTPPCTVFDCAAVPIDSHPARPTAQTATNTRSIFTIMASAAYLSGKYGANLAHVRLPTIPSACSPLAPWNSRTAWRVRTPSLPSIGPGLNPAFLSARWMSLVEDWAGTAAGLAGVRAAGADD